MLKPVHSVASSSQTLKRNKAWLIFSVNSFHSKRYLKMRFFERIDVLIDVLSQFPRFSWFGYCQPYLLLVLTTLVICDFVDMHSKNIHFRWDISSHILFMLLLLLEQAFIVYSNSKLFENSIKIWNRNHHLDWKRNKV